MIATSLGMSDEPKKVAHEDVLPFYNEMEVISALHGVMRNEASLSHDKH